ncbi:hypothetical protein FGF1_26260 [Flavobacteriaceae bacterium GF1]
MGYLKTKPEQIDKMTKKLLLLLFTIVISLNSHSQISFEKGYYIDNANQKKNCLIKNVDWKNNPTEFVYKLSENDEPQKATIKDVKEFGIDHTSKYIRSSVHIDRSSDYNIDVIDTYRNPILEEEVLFLKVLVEGKANLYMYEDGNLRRFFYNKDDTPIEQLTYKLYKKSNDRIGKNQRFKQQLLNGLQCPTFTIRKVENLEYKKNDLIGFFIDYNTCNDLDYINYEEKQKKDLFNLTLRPGFYSATLSIQNSILTSRNTDFDNEFGFRFGIEAELILPFNRNKWSFLIEPTYQSYQSEKEGAEVDYKSVELPVGVRHYFFLNDNSKIFVNGSFVFDLSFDSAIGFDTRSDLEVRTRNNLAFGIGYKFHEKYSLELRYQTNRDVLSNYFYWSSEYRSISMIFGYSLF